MIKHFFLLILITCLVTFAGCFFPKKENKADPGNDKAALIKAEQDFSALSLEKGMKVAFLEYIDSNGILLRPDMLPITDGDAIDYLIAVNDTGYSMSWKLKGAAVAASGELGYTYGLYEIRPTAKDTILYGTYLNIWKKQEDGKWKFVVDSGNEGIGE